MANMEPFQFDLGFLIGKIVTLIENEASSLRGVSDELDKIKLELVSMKSFLIDSERRRALEEGEKTWVANVRDLAHQIEDIIEEHTYHKNRSKFKGGKYTRNFYRTIRFPKNLWVKSQLATKLQEIHEKAKSISELRQRYRVDHVEGRNSLDNCEQVRNRRESSLFVKNDDLVGIQDDMHLLVEWLTSVEPKCTAISVVGMGGSGKTTLVAKVYDSIKQQFECHALIPVSQTYDLKDLIRSIIKEFFFSVNESVPVGLSTMSFTELSRTLTIFLMPKRYVLVLDDVWVANTWSELHALLPDEGRGSRVVLTTRIENVAKSCFGVKRYVHYLKQLGETDAWSLFCKKTFSIHPNNSCPQDLEEVAHQLVSKCNGLPLAIVTLGGVMFSKESVSEWRRIHDSLSWELSNEPMLEQVKTILLLSFSELSFSLKRCFLYCCLFPEDRLFRRPPIVRLWMAEGFVITVAGRTPEEEGKRYLMEIVGRSMLQCERTTVDGVTKFRCKMHDLMREVALSTAAIERFCSMYDSQKERLIENGTRFLSIQAHGREFEPWKGISQLRSLLVFPVGEISPSVKILPSGLRLLRVLYLAGVPIVKLPDELVEFFNLTYLNLIRTEVRELPKYIGRLQNLQSLNISFTKIRVLPTGITKLQNLRHLENWKPNTSGDEFFVFEGVGAPSTICNLKKLQILEGVEAEPNLLKNLRNMTQLKQLSICEVRERNENEELCTSIQSMVLLRKLWLQAADREEYLPIDAISSPPPNLKVLCLYGKLKTVPRWFQLLPHLTQLILRRCRLMEDPLPHLRSLPNLKDLWLINAYVTDQLHFWGGFQKLKRVGINYFPKLNGIIIEKGVMPGLELLIIHRCVQLKRVPDGVEYLIALKLLEFSSVSSELVDRIRGDGSQDRPKVQHILKIKHFYDTPSGQKYESLS